MRRNLLFGECSNLVDENNARLPDAISEFTGKPCSPHKAMLMRTGRIPISAFAWNALKSLHEDHCPEAQRLVNQAVEHKVSTVWITETDLQDPALRIIVLKAILQLPAGIKAKYDGPGS